MSDVIKEEVQTEYRTHCNKYEYCDECKYNGSVDCLAEFILDKYELKKKLNKEIEEINNLYEKYVNEHREYCHNQPCNECVFGTARGCVARFIMAKERGIL